MRSGRWLTSLSEHSRASWLQKPLKLLSAEQLSNDFADATARPHGLTVARIDGVADGGSDDAVASTTIAITASAPVLVLSGAGVLGPGFELIQVAADPTGQGSIIEVQHATFAGTPSASAGLDKSLPL